MRFTRRHRAGARRNNFPRLNRPRMGLLDRTVPPVLRTGRTGQEWSGAHNVDDSGRWRKQRYKQPQYGSLRLVASAAKELSCAVLFHTLESQNVGAINKSVGRLDEFLLQFLQLDLLLGPIPSVRRRVDGIDVLVVVDQRFNGFSYLPMEPAPQCVTAFREPQFFLRPAPSLPPVSCRSGGGITGPFSSTSHLTSSFFGS